MPHENRADHLAADERGDARRVSVRPAADLTRQQRLVTDAPLVHLAEPDGEAGIGRRRLEQVVQCRSRVDLGHRLEAVVAVVAVEDEDVAAVE